MKFRFAAPGDRAVPSAQARRQRCRRIGFRDLGIIGFIGFRVPLKGSIRVTIRDL